MIKPWFYDGVWIAKETTDTGEVGFAMEKYVDDNDYVKTRIRRFGTEEECEKFIKTLQWGRRKRIIKLKK